MLTPRVRRLYRHEDIVLERKDLALTNERGHAIRSMQAGQSTTRTYERTQTAARANLHEISTSIIENLIRGWGALIAVPTAPEFRAPGARPSPGTCHVLQSAVFLTVF